MHMEAFMQSFRVMPKKFVQGRFCASYAIWAFEKFSMLLLHASVARGTRATICSVYFPMLQIECSTHTKTRQGYETCRVFTSLH